MSDQAKEVAPDGSSSEIKEDAEAHFVSGFIGQADLFLRDQPVSARVPEGIRQLACEVIDHGGFIISNLRFPDEASSSRQMVITAVFRRILITAEAVRTLTNRGLEEPAFATLRTLLELELNLRLVVNDPTDRMARRLIYFYAIRGRRHFSKATRDTRTRELFQENNDHWTWAKEMSRSFKEQLSADEFEDIRQECEKDQYWHGFNSQKEAFDDAGMSHDYHTLFDSASPFVHASNVDHDVAEAGDGVRGLVQMDPAPAFTRLAYLASNLTVLFGLVLEATGQGQGYGPTAAIEGDDGTREELSAVEFLHARVLSVLGTVQSDFEPDDADAVHAAVAEAFSNQAVAVLRSGHLRPALEAFSDVLTRFAEVRAPGIEVYICTALLNKGYLHDKLEEPEEAIAAYDEAVRRFGDSPVPDVRLGVAMCLRNKGSMLATGSQDAARAVWDDLVTRFINDEIPEIQVQVASAFVKKAGSAISEHKSELAVEVCGRSVDRYGSSNDVNVQRQVALAMEMKGMAQNQSGLPGEALATYRDLVRRFGAMKCDRGLPVRWRALGIKLMASTLQGDQPAVHRTFRTICRELDLGNPVMLQKLFWDTIEAVAKGASPDPLADILTQSAERSEVLIPLLAALRRLAGQSMQVPEALSPSVDDIIKKIEARSQ